MTSKFYLVAYRNNRSDVPHRVYSARIEILSKNGDGTGVSKDQMRKAVSLTQGIPQDAVEVLQFLEQEQE